MSKVISCIVVDDEPMAREILGSFIEKVPNLQLVKSCKNATEALDAINSEKIDLFFLDINMPDITGLSLAKLISNKGKVIFTTAYREYAVEGFNLKAVDYLLKPIAFDRFLEAIHAFLETINPTISNEHSMEESLSDFFFVRSDRKMVRVDFESILYIESLSDYVKIHTDTKTIVTRETISNIEAKLPQKLFLRIHRSYIVAVKSISSYTNEFIEIHRKALPISRSYKEAILKKMENF